MKIKTVCFSLAGVVCATLIGVGLAKNFHTHAPMDLSSVSQEPMSPEELDVARDIMKIQGMVESALVWRAQVLQFYEGLKAKDKKGEPYSAAELQLIHEQVKRYLLQRQSVLSIAKKYAWMADSSRELELAPGKGTLNAAPNGASTIRIDPTDREGNLAIRRLKVSLSTALLLYDNYLIAIYPFQGDGKLRRTINFDTAEQERALQEVTSSFIDRAQILAAQRAIRFFDDEQFWRKKNNALANDNGTQYLDLLILGSASYTRIRDLAWYDRLANKVDVYRLRLRDRIVLMKNETTNAVSGVFGNTVGLVQFRDGKMKNLPKEQYKELYSKLRPLDVLLEKTPFRVTDKFIPGHYGHVAIWVGTPQELKDLGLWDHPAVVPHHAALESGHGVLEALRPGVQINTLEHFLDIDDLAIIRHKPMTLDQTREHLVRAFMQIGKEYDFNFDVETDRRIVCSELAYVVFANEKWPTEKKIGRITISPDNVAVRAVDGGPFELIELWTDGHRVATNLTAVYQALLKGEAGDFAELERLVAANSLNVQTPSMGLDN